MLVASNSSRPARGVVAREAPPTLNLALPSSNGPGTLGPRCPGGLANALVGPCLGDVLVAPAQTRSARRTPTMAPLLYHEKQVSLLCGVHALNTLLQGPYFSAHDLADIAREFDERERQLMASAGVESADFLRYMAVRATANTTNHTNNRARTSRTLPRARPPALPPSRPSAPAPVLHPVGCPPVPFSDLTRPSPGTVPSHRNAGGFRQRRRERQLQHSGPDQSARGVEPHLRPRDVPGGGQRVARTPARVRVPVQPRPTLVHRPPMRRAKPHRPRVDRRHLHRRHVHVRVVELQQRVPRPATDLRTVPLRVSRATQRRGVFHLVVRGVAPRADANAAPGPAGEYGRWITPEEAATLNKQTETIKNAGRARNAAEQGVARIGAGGSAVLRVAGNVAGSVAGSVFGRARETNAKARKTQSYKPPSPRVSGRLSRDGRRRGRAWGRVRAGRRSRARARGEPSGRGTPFGTPFGTPSTGRRPRCRHRRELSRIRPVSASASSPFSAVAADSTASGRMPAGGPRWRPSRRNRGRRTPRR